MLVPDEMRKSVVFVYLQRNGEKFAAGTAIQVADHDPAYPDRAWGMLLTAHHVIAGVSDKGDDGQVHIRFNTVEGDSAWHSLPVDDWFQPDPGLDFAVALWTPPEEANADRRAWSIAHGGVATDDVIRQEGIGIGDEVFLVGLFRNHPGRSRNEPIIRVGNIAALPAEPIRTSVYGDMPGILIEARSIGGLSGAPVFVHMGFARWRGGEVVRAGIANPFFFLGLIHGHWDRPTLEAPGTDANATGEQIHTGIGIVVPADKIMSALVPFRGWARDAYRKIFDRDSAPTQDFAGPSAEFDNALRKVLSVSKEDVQKAAIREKKARDARRTE